MLAKPDMPVTTATAAATLLNGNDYSHKNMAFGNSGLAMEGT